MIRHAACTPAVKEAGERSEQRSKVAGFQAPIGGRFWALSDSEWNGPSLTSVRPEAVVAAGSAGGPMFKSVI